MGDSRPPAILRPGAFLDRDGTLMRDMHYPRDPALVALIPGAARAVQQLAGMGMPVVVVTNQSGIAQGRVSPAEYEAVRARLDALLAEAGVHLDGSYHCPHHPDFSGPCECRKPGLLLYLTAAREHRIDTTRALFAGDRWRDVGPGLALGGCAVLVPSDATPAADRERAEREALVLPTLEEAVARFRAHLEGRATDAWTAE